MSSSTCTCLAGKLSLGPHTPKCPAYDGDLLPHKQTLTIEKGIGDFNRDRWLYAGPDIEIGMISEMAPGGAECWAKFFQAAPLVARALLATGEAREIGGSIQWHTRDCHGALKAFQVFGRSRCLTDCEQTRAALTAAGVPLA